jgi:hypothetical protein
MMIGNIRRWFVHKQVINKLSTLKLESGKPVKVTATGEQAIKGMDNEQSKMLLDILKSFDKATKRQKRQINDILKALSDEDSDTGTKSGANDLALSVNRYINRYNGATTASSQQTGQTRASRNTGSATRLRQKAQASQLREAKLIADSKKELKETSRTIGNMISDVWKDVKFFFACLAINAKALVRGARKEAQDITKPLQGTQKKQGIGTQIRTGINEAYRSLERAAGQAADATLGSGPVSDAWYAQGIDKKAQRQINKLHAEYFTDKTVTQMERGANRIGDAVNNFWGTRERRNSGG